VCHETLLALHKIKIIIHLASFLILTSLFSCQNDKKSSGNVVESQQQSEFHTDFQTAQFETQFSEVKCFMNGDSILHAQNATEWKIACNDKKPAWCYADEKNKNGLLYNYYALSDKRGIIPNQKKLTLKIAEKLKNELVHRKKEWTLEFVDQSYVQRAFNGRNYNLKFVQFWIFNEEHMSDNQAQIMVWDLKLKKFTIELASVNNGYRIWLLK
jgi:hypothetical protein